jgi:hypothetical protein
VPRRGLGQRRGEPAGLGDAGGRTLLGLVQGCVGGAGLGQGGSVLAFSRGEPVCGLGDSSLSVSVCLGHTPFGLLGVLFLAACDLGVLVGPFGPSGCLGHLSFGVADPGERAVADRGDGVQHGVQLFRERAVQAGRAYAVTFGGGHLLAGLAAGPTPVRAVLRRPAAPVVVQDVATLAVSTAPAETE